MKKFSFIFLAFMLMFPAFFIGCSQNNNNSSQESKPSETTEISIKYDYIGYEQVSDEYSKVAFQIDIENNSDEDIYILKNNFQIKASAWYTDSYNVRKDVNDYETETKVYLDSNYTQEATLSTVVTSNQKVTFYVVAPMISTEKSSASSSGRVFGKENVIEAKVYYSTEKLAQVELILN